MKREIQTIQSGLNHRMGLVFPDHCHNGVIVKIIIQGTHFRMPPILVFMENLLYGFIINNYDSISDKK